MGALGGQATLLIFFLLMFQIKILQFKNNNNINLLSLKKKLKRIYFFSFKKNVEMLDLDFIQILLKKKKEKADMAYFHVIISTTLIFFSFQLLTERKRIRNLKP